MARRLRRVCSGVLTAVALALAVAWFAAGPARANFLPSQITIGNSTSGSTPSSSSATSTPLHSTSTIPGLPRTPTTSVATRTTVTRASSTTTVARSVVPVPTTGSAPTSYQPAYTAPVSTAPATTAPPTTPETIAPLGGTLPVSPVTLPLATKQSNPHVSPALAVLSGAGFLVALAMVTGRLVVTRPGGPDRPPPCPE